MENRHKIDEIFLSILGDWVSLITETAEGSVSSILNHSREYLSVEQRKALIDFHDLYFSQSELSVTRDVMNKDVDDLFEAIKADISAGGDGAKVTSIAESNTAKQARLSLSGVQKQLETIIQLEVGLKEKLLPVLSNMQFEDALRQRLTRMLGAWKISLETSPIEDSSIKELGNKIAKTLGSKVEREAFYPLVLGQEAPKDAVESIVIFDTFL